MKKNLIFALALMFISFAIISCGGKKQEQETVVEEATETTLAPTSSGIDYSSWEADFENGKKVYSKTCMTCHFSGVTGAPALQPEKYVFEEWQTRADLGINVLMEHSINGYTNPETNALMPPRGTCMDCTDKDLFDAIYYMYTEAKATIKK